MYKISLEIDFNISVKEDFYWGVQPSQSWISKLFRINLKTYTQERQAAKTLKSGPIISTTWSLQVLAQLLRTRERASQSCPCGSWTDYWECF